jgi:hypothetical protein
MNRAPDTGSYILEEIELEVDPDSDGEYVGVDVDEAPAEESVPQSETVHPPSDGSQPSILKLNEVVDDYVRNFLRYMNMEDTFRTFQRE